MNRIANKEKVADFDDGAFSSLVKSKQRLLAEEQEKLVNWAVSKNPRILSSRVI